MKARRFAKLGLAAVCGTLLVQAPAQAKHASPPIGGVRNYDYVDLSQQRLYEIHNYKVTRMIHISSGGGYTYTGSDGSSHVAATPVGKFQIYKKQAGWQTSYLGSMYYPSYFTGGFAIHGETSVPNYPASHGCVRIPMSEAIGFYNRNPVGTPVYVVN